MKENTQLLGQFSGVLSASTINPQISPGLELTTFAVFMVLIMSLPLRKTMHGLRQHRKVEEHFP